MTMNNNKVMIKVVVPSIDKEYDIKVPVNEVLWKINKLIIKAIFDMNSIMYDLKKDNYVMINKTTGEIYKNNDILIDTDIRNGTEIVFLKEMA